MKKVFSITVFLLFWTVIDAQVRPEAFMGMLPSVPGNICSDDNKQEEDEFIAKLDEISELLQNELDRRSENNDAESDAKNQQVMFNTVKTSGISPELIQQLMALEKQSKGATGEQAKAYEAQRKAITDQMIQQKMNISVAELDNLKTADSAGQRAWATGYAVEAQAEVNADPQKYKDQNAKEMQKHNLQKKYKQLTDSLNAQQNKYMQKFAEIDEDEEGKNLLAIIEGIREKIADLYNETAKAGRGPDQQILVALRSEMYLAKVNYCNVQTPKYISVLDEYKSFIQSSMPAYYRLEKLTNEVMKMQTGVNNSPEPGQMGLGNVSGFINRLRSAYKYNLYGPEDLTIG
ncbi:MAG: hypothetical protein Q7U54_00645 [Bacteroidales bacterium]|nr:hypothetical protein [Bacteroidales bacterium]